MGNDGGSIPKRRELVKEAARDPSTTQLKETQNEQQQYHWTTCPLSHQPLASPIVSDSSGTLYTKAAILEFLLEGGKGPEGRIGLGGEVDPAYGVKSLRDVIEVKLQEEEKDEQEKSKSSAPSKWVCPVTNKPLGPGVKAVYLVPCGHAFSESAIKEMSGENCLQCNAPYTSENVISILPTSAIEKERLRVRAQRLKDQGLSHSLKPTAGTGKKRKKNALSSQTATVNGLEPTLAHSESGTNETQGNIRNEGTASLTAKVLAEQDDRQKKRRLGTNDNIKSLFSSKNGMDEKHRDFMTRGFSIPANAKR